MKKTILLFTFLLVTLITYCQRYYTTGIVQYQKLDGTNYKRTTMLPSFSVTWGIYTDNKLVRVQEGDKVVFNIKKKTKVGNTTTYILDEIMQDATLIIVEGVSVTLIEGDNKEIKNVYKITKKEKIDEPLGDY